MPVTPLWTKFLARPGADRTARVSYDRP
jgi:hypothetical protein